jgi:ABC-2 type transport system ATP-binding protein
MTVAEVMRFASAMYNNWSFSLADHLCHKFELPKDRRIKQLSRGMKVKAALLVALAHRPTLLVLDEPMSGLDPLARDELLEVLVDIREHETECVVFSSHQIDDVTRVADEIAILHEGRILVHKTLEAMLLDTKRIEAVVVDGRLPECDLPQIIWQHLNRRQWSATVHPFDTSLVRTLDASDAILSSRVEELSLEQIFKDWIRGAKASC